MDFEKIEQAYTYLLENVQIIQNDLATSFYDALIEQNGIYLDGQTNLEDVKKNNQALKTFGTSKRGVVTDLSIFVNEGSSNRTSSSQSPVHTRCGWSLDDFYH